MIIEENRDCLIIKKKIVLGIRIGIYVEKTAFAVPTHLPTLYEIKIDFHYIKLNIHLKLQYNFTETSVSEASTATTTLAPTTSRPPPRPTTSRKPTTTSTTTTTTTTTTTSTTSRPSTSAPSEGRLSNNH